MDLTITIFFKAPQVASARRPLAAKSTRKCNQMTRGSMVSISPKSL
jgi:hypothetical protein